MLLRHAIESHGALHVFVLTLVRKHQKRIVGTRVFVVVLIFSEFDAHGDILEFGHHVFRKVADGATVARALSEETERRRLVVSLAVETPTGELESLHRQTIRDPASLVYDGELMSPSRGIGKPEPLDDGAELSRIGVMEQVATHLRFKTFFLSKINCELFFESFFFSINIGPPPVFLKKNSTTEVVTRRRKIRRTTSRATR